LPELVPALQEATPLPLAFDSPNLKYHQRALQHYDFRRSPAPMVNSLAVSREDLDGFYEIIGHYKTDVIVMAAEGMGEDGRPRPNFEPDEVLAISLRFVEKLRSLGIDNDKIFIDPGLFPVTGDTSGRVSMSLEAIRKIRASSDLQGVHTCVGLTNFSLGAPKEVRHLLECAYLTMAHPLGLDAILASPEKDWRLLSQDDPVLLKLKEALAFRAGTPRQKRPT
ncbi:MAG TPA: dihydropteroate synthase, partial [Polyangiaceae bacterium]